MSTADVTADRGPGGMMRSSVKLTAKLALVCMAVDQLTKVLARSFLPLCRLTDPSCIRWGLGKEFGLIRVANEGSALGFGQSLGIWVLISVLGLIMAAGYTRGRPDSWVVLAAGLQLGGAAGNLLDRVAFGGATDFLQIAPVVMNVADLMLLAGTVVGTRALWRSGLRTDTEEVRT
jgi:signal peptidase II